MAKVLSALRIHVSRAAQQMNCKGETCNLMRNVTLPSSGKLCKLDQEKAHKMPIKKTSRKSRRKIQSTPQSQEEPDIGAGKFDRRRQLQGETSPLLPILSCWPEVWR